MPQPTLSVLMSNYNHAHYLPEALQALVDQSHPADEIIVLDDGSTDNSVEVITALAAKFPVIKLIRNENNRGVVACMNKLLEAAEGDYVFCSAADDRVLPGVIEKSMALLARHPEASFCSALSCIIDEQGGAVGLARGLVPSKEPCYLTPERVRRLVLRGKLWVHATTVFFRRRALLDAGGFDEKMGCFCDAFIYRALTLRHGACFIPEPLVCWRLAESGYSSMEADPIRYFQANRNVIKTMRSDMFRDVFPESYIARFERRQPAAFIRANLGRLRLQQEKTLVSFLLPLLPADQSRGAALLKILSLIAKLQTLVSLIYHAIRRKSFSSGQSLETTP